MVRLSAATVAVLVGLSNILGVVAQEEDTPPVEPAVSTIDDLEGKVTIGFPTVNLTALFVEAENELGLNGTITSTFPTGETTDSTKKLARRFAEHSRMMRKRFLPSITGTISCWALKLIFADKIALKGTSTYNAWNNPSFWASNTYMEPSCVFKPTEPEEISLAMRLFQLGVPTFNVVGGGHSAIKGWANAEDGVLILLAGFKGVTFKSGSAVIGTGERWGDVFTELDKKKVQALGGRMSPVGVPGLTLGGGISYLTNHYGFVCDQVKSFQVVLSDGSIVTASAATNADLFRALKGGSGNFGIVTAIELYTWPSEKVYSGQLTFTDPNDLEKLIKIVYDYHTVGALQDTATHLISAFVYIGAYQMHLGAFTAFRNVAVADPGPALKPVLDLNPTVTNTSTLQLRPYGTQAVELGSGNVNGLRQDMRDFSAYANEDFYRYAWNLWKQRTAQFKNVPGFMGTIAFQPITTKAVAAGVARGGNSLGLEKNTKTMAVINLTHQWADASVDASLKAVLDQLVADLITKAKSMGVYHPYFYLNYAKPENDPIRAYGAESVARLKAARKRYDDAQMFQFQVPGGFKVPA